MPYFLLLLVLFVTLALVVMAGPRVSVHYQPTRIRLPHDPQDLDDYLADAEAKIPDLTEGAERAVIWAHPDRRRTAFSIVYVHGFAATRREVAPLADLVARTLGANLYYARLRGHGRSGQAMAQVTLQDWLDDMRESMAIGRLIGDQVILVGTSTGGTLATWVSMQDHTPSPAALVLLSPNFGPRRWETALLTWPWARHFVPWIQGDSYSWLPHNAAHARYWTTRFPVEGLFPMAAAVKLVRSLDPSGLEVPILILYAPEDGVVDATRIEGFYRRLTIQPRRLVSIEDTADPDRHILAGDILSPDTTGPVASHILAFLDQAIPQR
jgi:alpha-beta hydrolase superfamily lysophospholipase